MFGDVILRRPCCVGDLSLCKAPIKGAEVEVVTGGRRRLE